MQSRVTNWIRVALVVVTLPISAKMLTFTTPPTASRRNVQIQVPELPSEVVFKNKANIKKFEVEKDWGLTNIGFFDMAYPVVNANNCQSDVVVAIVDTGIDYTHPALKDSLWVNKGEVGPWTPPAGVITSCRDKSCNGIDDDHNGFEDDVVGWDFVHEVPLPYDTHGHGTHIAGIIDASSNVKGVCPKVSLMALKYYDANGAGYNNLTNTVRAIQYAISMGANIINYSGGGSDPSAAEKLAVEQAQSKGILFVAAAGNDGHNNDSTPYFPANYGLDNIVSVASVNKANQLLPSSNYGKTVMIGAPGLMIQSTLPEGRFGTMSGTSQATAYVTGAAAFLATQTQKTFDFRKVKNWLLSGAKPFKNNEKKLAAGLLYLPKSLSLGRLENKPNTQLAAAVASKPNKKLKITN